MSGNPIIISCALTGSQSSKAKNPAVPVTPQEIADAAYSAWQAGAAIVHLHMRDAHQQATMDPKLYRETIDLIRAHTDCDVVLNCTSSGGTPVTHKKRLEPFETIPEIEIGSYDAGTLNWGCSYVFANPPMFLEELGEVYQDNDVFPEVEIFDAGMIGNTKYYLDEGILPKKMWYQLVLGVLGGADATVEDLAYLKSKLPAGALWSATGIGRGHLPILYGAIAMGGHVRVGLEDNLYYEKGVLATNDMLVERAVRVAKEFGREPATSAQAREILGIPPLER